MRVRQSAAPLLSTRRTETLLETANVRRRLRNTMKKTEKTKQDVKKLTIKTRKKFDETKRRKRCVVQTFVRVYLLK